jgi:serine/threonine protein kinase
VIKVIGKGTFGTVRQVQYLRDGKVYAIKSIPLNQKNLKYKVSAITGQLQEVEIMRQLQHPGIIRMLGSFADANFTSQAEENRSPV